MLTNSNFKMTFTFAIVSNISIITLKLVDKVEISNSLYSGKLSRKELYSLFKLEATESFFIFDNKQIESQWVHF